MYRVQVLGRNTLAMHWQRHKVGAGHWREMAAKGERMPVVIALGGDPASIYSGSAPLPPTIDEFLFAGFIRRQPVELARALTSDLAVPAEAELVLGQMKATVRRNYSSPAIHAAGIVSRVLSDPTLRASWESDVAAMRDRILAMRRRLHGVLAAKLPGRDFGYFLSQRGMFSYTGLSAAQVDQLREDHAVYLVRSGRMCVAGLNSHNVEAVAAAMAAVL